VLRRNRDRLEKRFVDADVERRTPYLEVRLVEVEQRMLCLDLPFVEIDAKEEDEEDGRMVDDGGLEDCAELAVC